MGLHLVIPFQYVFLGDVPFSLLAERCQSLFTKRTPSRSQSYGVIVIGAPSSTFSPCFLAARASSRAGSRPTKMVATAQTAQAMRAKKKVSFMPRVRVCCPTQA